MTTVVSAYYLLKSRKKIIFKQDFFTWVENFLSNIDCNLVFFCEEDLLEKFTEYRKKYLHKTKFIILRRENWIAYTRYGKSFWNIQHSIDDQISIHCPDIYCVWYEKKEFVLRAIDINPFKTEKFIWCDAGAFRSKEEMSKLINFSYDSEKLIPDDKIVLLLLKSFSEEEKENSIIKANKNRIGGGVQAASIKTWRVWSAIYDNMMNTYISNNKFVGIDQTVMMSIAIENPNLVQLIPAYHDIPDYYFTLLYYFQPRS